MRKFKYEIFKWISKKKKETIKTKQTIAGIYPRPQKVDYFLF